MAVEPSGHLTDRPRFEFHRIAVAAPSSEHRPMPDAVVRAVRAGGGAPLDPMWRAVLEPRFGRSLHHLRVHSGRLSDEAARSIGAEAFSLGDAIHLGSGQSSRGLHVLAHEVAHALQAPGPGRGEPVAVGSPGDPLEIDAQRAADRVVRGMDAGLSIRGAGPPGVVRRFASSEHLELGRGAWRGAESDIDIGTAQHPQRLTFAAMQALAGDYFESLAEMRRLARTQDGRDQLRWARWQALSTGREPAVAQSVKDAVMDRYYQLAGRNVSHFSAGGTAMTTYRSGHRHALRLAFRAGTSGSPEIWQQAQTAEAFAHHFLADMFAAGHIRTPIDEIRRWYRSNHPDALDQLIRFMAREIEPHVGNLGPFDFAGEARVEQELRDAAGAALQAFSLGDLVSLAQHDRDNRLGLHVISQVNPARRRVPGGYHFWATGDDNLARSPRTREMAIAALRRSIAELHTMRTAGQSTGPVADGPPFERAVNAALRTLGTPYAAERFVPRHDAASTDPVMAWQWGSFNQEMRNALADSIRREIVPRLREQADRQTGGARTGMMGFVRELRLRPVEVLERAIGRPAGP